MNRMEVTMHYDLMLAALLLTTTSDDGPASHVHRTGQNSKELAADVIVRKLRKQGVSCQGSASAERAQEYSKPNVTAWALKCENATYRVLLIPSRPAEVETME